MPPSAVSPGFPGLFASQRSAASDDVGRRDPLSGLRALLLLAPLLAEQSEPGRILHLVAAAVPTLTPCRTDGIMFGSRWHEMAPHGARPRAALQELMAVLDPLEGGPLPGPDELFTYAYPLANGRQASGYLVVSADLVPDDNDQFLLRALARHAGVALANAVLQARERDRSAALRAACSALERSVAVHQRLARVALQREGQQGVVDAVHDLTGCPAAVEDRQGHLWAWAGAGRPENYAREPAGRRNAVLRMAVAADGPIRDGARLVSVARVDDEVMGVLVLLDTGEVAGEAERRWVLEQATAVLVVELAHVRSQAESEGRRRADLVVDLLAGTDEIGALSLARGLRYDLERPHWVVLIEGRAKGDTLLNAVRRVARDVGAGSLMVGRPDGVVLLADSETDWDRFRRRLVGEVRGERPRMAVGRRCDHFGDFARSYREAQQALKLQVLVGGRDQVTTFEDLGIYQVFCDLPDLAALDQLVERWLGPLLAYDVKTGSQLTDTLSSYLEHGSTYDAAARALSVHRSTLKYRLSRIREVSGLDLNDPGTNFHLQLATRARRARQALQGR
ncbi:MAG: PucR family transcriptional regulator [Acidimicrobiales bacterium]